MNLTTSRTVLLSIAGGALAFVLFVAAVASQRHEAKVTVRVPQYPKPLDLSADALIAHSAIVYDPKNHRILFSKNAQETLPLASLTKLMTAQAVLYAKAPTSTVTITAADLSPDGDWGFMPGDRVRLSDLIRFGLVASSNDAMAAAAASIGDDYIVALNKTAGELGLTRTLFLNPTGLDVDQETSGAYGTVFDVAVLASVFMREHPGYFESTTAARVSIPVGDRVLTAKATSLPLQDIPGFIGAKTGYTDLAGGNLVAAFDIDVGHPLVAVVLGSTERGRFDDVRALIEAVRAQKAPEL